MILRTPTIGIHTKKKTNVYRFVPESLEQRGAYSLTSLSVQPVFSITGHSVLAGIWPED